MNPIGELDPSAARLKDVADFISEALGFRRGEVEEREAGNDRADFFHWLTAAAEQIIEFPGVAGNDLGAGEFFAQDAGHVGILLNSDEFFLAQAALKEGLGDNAGAGAEFEDKAVGISGERAGHGLGKFGRAGGDGAHALRIGKPFLQEQRGVGQRRQ